MNTTNNAGEPNTAYLDGLIASAHEQEEREAHIMATGFAEASADESQVAQYERGIQASYDRLMAQVRHYLQSGLAKTQGRMVQSDMEDEVRRIDQEAADQAHEGRVAMTDLRRIPIDYNWNRYPLWIAAELVFFLGEVGGNAYAFSVLGGTILTSIPWAIGFGIAAFSAAFFIPRMIEANPNREERKKLWKRFLLTVFCVYVIIGVLRTLLVGGRALQMLLYPLGFAGLNMFMFMGGVLISWKGLPTKEQTIAKRLYDAQAKKVEAIEKRQAYLKAERERVISHAKSSMKHYMALMATEAHYVEYIRSLEARTLAIFRSEFELRRRKRTDLIG